VICKHFTKSPNRETYGSIAKWRKLPESHKWSRDQVPGDISFRHSALPPCTGLALDPQPTNLASHNRIWNGLLPRPYMFSPPWSSAAFSAEEPRDDTMHTSVLCTSFNTHTQYTVTPCLSGDNVALHCRVVMRSWEEIWITFNFWAGNQFTSLTKDVLSTCSCQHRGPEAAGTTHVL
jgi:hypothetical protein